jgi:hypothetical protein
VQATPNKIESIHHNISKTLNYDIIFQTSEVNGLQQKYIQMGWNSRKLFEELRQNAMNRATIAQNIKYEKTQLSRSRRSATASQQTQLRIPRRLATASQQTQLSRSRMLATASQQTQLSRSGRLSSASQQTQLSRSGRLSSASQQTQPGIPGMLATASRNYIRNQALNSLNNRNMQTDQLNTLQNIETDRLPSYPTRSITIRPSARRGGKNTKKTKTTKITKTPAKTKSQPKKKTTKRKTTKK